MKTIFEKTTRDELITRLNTLNENSQAQWGKMNVYQMLKHCTLYEELLLGKKKFKRVFLGYFFGKMALADLLKESELRRNMPTIPEIRVTEEQGDVASEKRKWIALIKEHEHFSSPNVVHPFCGKLTEEQVGQLAYKHADHHLRQFNS